LRRPKKSQNCSRVKLIKDESMCRAIAAHDVEEVKDIRDKALALEHYARQALNTDAERKAAKIRIRAENKAGDYWLRGKPTASALIKVGHKKCRLRRH
jgi:hypothetical protein